MDKAPWVTEALPQYPYDSPLEAHKAAFSPDSRSLLTGSLGGVASLWALGKYEVPGNDRNVLIEFGAQRLTRINLTLPECEKLRAMDIPLFAFADLDYKVERGFMCPLPFLAPRPAAAE